MALGSSGPARAHRGWRLRAYFNGLRVGPISVVSGMVAAYGGLTVVLSVVFRGESLTTVQALGATIATVGVILTGVAFGGGLRGTRFAGPGVVLPWSRSCCSR